MTVYNVRVTFVALVEAESPEEAIAKFTNQVETRVDCEAFDDPGVEDTQPHAFESEPLVPGVTPIR